MIKKLNDEINRLKSIEHTLCLTIGELDKANKQLREENERLRRELESHESWKAISEVAQRELEQIKAEYSDERAAHNVHVTELIEAQKLIEKLEKTNVKFPRQPKREGGWTVAMDYLKGISDRLYDLSCFGDLGDTPPSLEQIEMVLLAVEESQINWKLKRQFQP